MAEDPRPRRTSWSFVETSESDGRKDLDILSPSSQRRYSDIQTGVHQLFVPDLRTFPPKQNDHAHAMRDRTGDASPRIPDSTPNEGFSMYELLTKSSSALERDDGDDQSSSPSYSECSSDSAHSDPEIGSPTQMSVPDVPIRNRYKANMNTQSGPEAIYSSEENANDDEIFNEGGKKLSNHNTRADTRRMARKMAQTPPAISSPTQISAPDDSASNQESGALFDWGIISKFKRPRDKKAGEESSMLSNAMDVTARRDDENETDIQTVAGDEKRVAVKFKSPAMDVDDSEEPALLPASPPVEIFSGTGSATTTPERFRCSQDTLRAESDSKVNDKAPRTSYTKDSNNEIPRATPRERLQEINDQVFATPMKTAATRTLRDAWAMSRQQNEWLQARLITVEEQSMQARHALAQREEQLDKDLKTYEADAKAYKEESKESVELINNLQEEVEIFKEHNQNLLDIAFQRKQECSKYCRERKIMQVKIKSLEEKLKDALKKDQFHRKLKLERDVLLVQCKALEQHSANLGEELEKSMALITVQGQLEKEFEKELDEYDERREQEEHHQSPEGRQESFMVCDPMTHWHTPPDEVSVQVPGFCTHYNTVSITMPVMESQIKNEQKHENDKEVEVEAVGVQEDLGKPVLRKLGYLPIWLLTLLGFILIISVCGTWHERYVWLAADDRTASFFQWWFKIPSQWPGFIEDHLAERTYRLALEMQHKGQLGRWG